jgi:hypothetical protein
MQHVAIGVAQRGHRVLGLLQRRGSLFARSAAHRPPSAGRQGGSAMPMLMPRAPKLPPVTKHHGRFRSRKLKCSQGLLGRLSASWASSSAHRVAGEQHLRGGEPAFHAGIGRADAVRAFAEQAVGGAGQAVLFLDQRGHARALGRGEQRSAGVAAGAHGHVGPELTDAYPGGRPRGSSAGAKAGPCCFQGAPSVGSPGWAGPRWDSPQQAPSPFPFFPRRPRRGNGHRARRAFTASAMATAGKMWPPVPPPDTSIVKRRAWDIGEVAWR